MTTGSASRPGDPKRTQTYSAAQRIAVVITVLGEAAARPILEKLDDQTLSKVRDAIEDVPSIPVEVLRDIIQNFTAHARSGPSGLISKRDEARKIVNDVVASRGDAPADAASRAEPAQAGDIWARIEKRPSAKFGAYLRNLPPNLVSMVLRRLSPQYAAEVLCHLDEARLRPVLGYMVQPPPTDPGIDQIVTRMLELEFLNADEDAGDENQEHLGMLGEMLSLIPAGKRDSLIDFLKSNHETKLSGIQKSLFTIEGLPDMLPRNAVPVIFRDLDSKMVPVLMKSLETSYPAVSEFLLSNISSRLAAQIREELADMTPVQEVLAETVQRELLALLMKKKRSGELNPD